MHYFKFYFILSIALFSIHCASGQDFRLGARTGASYFTLDHEATNDQAEYQLGVDVALAGEWQFSPIFSLQPELHYTQKGVAFDYMDEGVRQEMHFKTGYLELPLLLKARYTAGPCELYAFAAPSIGYAVDRFVNTKIGGAEKERTDIDFIDEGPVQDQRWEFSVLGGLGAGIGAGPGQLVLDVRYSYGLTDDTKFEDNKPDDWSTTKTRGCTISVGYMIPIGQ